MEKNKMRVPTIIVRNLAQGILYERELCGQISDGFWENEDTDTRLWVCDVEVYDPKIHNGIGCTFIPDCDLDFDDVDLHWLMETRALGYVKEEIPDYTVEQLHEDLKDLTQIVFGKKH